MNIFVLDENPKKAACYLCDKHVPKMVLESAQLLCSVFEPGSAPYKRTHYNHPCSVWTRQSQENYLWLLNHADALVEEYTERFGKVHKSAQVINWCGNMFVDHGLITTTTRTPFAQAMPDKYKHKNAVTAYRNYYIHEKAKFARWERGTKPPPWWPEVQVEATGDRVSFAY